MRLRAFNAFLTIIDHAREHGVALQFSPQFDKAAGTDLVRLYAQGACTRAHLCAKINHMLDEFYKKASTIYHYQPLGQVIHVA
jgi:hypothetical protein